MQENVIFFHIKLHKNAYFSVSKVHKIAKSVISTGQKDQVKKSNKYIKLRTDRECKSVPSVPSVLPTEEREMTDTRPRNKINNSCARHE